MASVHKLELSPQLTKISFNNDEMEEKFKGDGQAAAQNGQRIQNAAIYLKLQSMLY